MAATVFSPPRLRSQGFEGGKNRRLSITTMYLESKSTVHFEASARFLEFLEKTVKRSSCPPLGIYRAAISTWVPPTRQQGHVAKALGGRHGRELTSICGSELDILK